jgi:NAD(P)-dependent dehydrogenase (short-subunit alcohol dehydrogenase family)
MEGKVVLITGAGKGIGRFVAHTFADAGAKVAVNDIAPLANVTRELEEKETEVLAVPADVRNEDQVRAMVERVLDRFGRIDVLLNNAAIVPHFQWGLPVWPHVRDMDKAFFDRVIGTNLGGTFLCTKHVLPHLEARRSGHIVNTMGGSSPERPGGLAYAVSKDAIRTFTRFVAEEERESNVCVVAIRPGAQIATEEAPEEARQRMPGPESVGNRFVLAAAAPMDLTGNLLDIKNGHLVLDAR